MGALNTYIMALHEKNDTQGTISELSKLRSKLICLAAFWTAFSRVQTIKSWPGGLVYGMFFEKGIYDSSAANNFLESWFVGRPILRHFSIGVTDVLSGK